MLAAALLSLIAFAHLRNSGPLLAATLLAPAVACLAGPVTLLAQPVHGDVLAGVAGGAWKGRTY